MVIYRSGMEFPIFIPLSITIINSILYGQVVRDEDINYNQIKDVEKEDLRNYQHSILYP